MRIFTLLTKNEGYFSKFTIMWKYYWFDGFFTTLSLFSTYLAFPLETLSIRYLIQPLISLKENADEGKNPNTELEPVTVDYSKLIVQKGSFFKNHNFMNLRILTWP